MSSIPLRLSPRSTFGLGWLLIAAIFLSFVGCSQENPAPEPRIALDSGPVNAPGTTAAPLLFREEILPFSYERGESGAAWPCEVTGGGVAMLDVDGDGDLDLFFAQGVPLPVGKMDPAQAPADVLLLNDGKGHFTDVSKVWGLSSKGYGQGLAVADYDADGDPDVYVTRYGANTMWRNDGGRFSDVTAEAGVGCPLWSLGAAFLDYDGDGDLDLLVANYFEFDPTQAPFLRLADGKAEYGPPDTFGGLPDVLYRNDGNGRFSDVTAEAGISDQARGMGVLAADFDGDHRMDILVANDAEANALWRNLGNGTFEEIASAVGIDLNGQGKSEANMGIAHGDTDGDGLQDVIISHFFGEHDTLWRARGGTNSGLFYQDETFQAGLGGDSRPFTGWGIALEDFDSDGWLDFVVTNGQIRQELSQKYPYENPPIFWLGQADRKFRNVTSSAGAYFEALHMGRGLAAGDLDGDGDLDLVITHHKAPSVVLWNESAPVGRWLKLDLRGRAPNRDAIGAEVTVEASGRRLVRSVDGGGSYLSVNDRRLHFGLGKIEQVDRVTVRWPSGREESKTDVPLNRAIRWDELE